MPERRAAENVRHGALRTLPVRRRSAYTDVVIRCLRWRFICVHTRG